MKKFQAFALVVIAAFTMTLAGCSKSEATQEQSEDRAEAAIDWQMITPKDMKEVLETKDSTDYQIVDIQPEEDFQAGHLPHSVGIAAYPVDTKELEQRVIDHAEDFKKGEHPIYVVCPGGGGGAKRTVSLLIDEGIKESRLYIVENGAKKWPYKNDDTLWVKGE